MRTIKNQQGIALIQVLLITAILSILALFLTQSAKDQVKQAQWLNDKAYAQVDLHSAEALLMFELLTKKKQINLNRPDDDNQSISQRWNFYNLSFNLSEYTIAKIQDQSGLINLHYPKIELLKKLLASKGLSQNSIEKTVDSLLDWQDVDNIQRRNGAETARNSIVRNGAVPFVKDIENISSLSPTVQELIIRNTTLHQAGAFSVFNAPAELLSALTNENAVTQIMELRREQGLDYRKFSEVTGIVESDNTYFYVSNYLMLDLRSEVGESKVYKKVYIHLKPYAKGNQKPFNLFLSSGL